MNNVAEEAWNATKDTNDPEYALIPDMGFRENLDFRAAKVRETGIAITNFEEKVAEIIASEVADDAPMAVVDTPLVKTEKAVKKSASKGTQKTDKSGHVPSEKEAAAIVKEEKTAPLH